MQFRDWVLLASCVAVVSGCVAQTAALSPVGPPPMASASANSESALVVFTAVDFATPGNELGRYHSGYSLYSEGGKKMKHVTNRSGPGGGEPERIRLPPGRYKVIARAAAFGTVTVPIVIEAGKTTSVHLDGSEPTGSSPNSGASFVSLPDGLIIGWRAKDEEEKN